MSRVFLQYALPLLLPFVLYAAYIYFGRRRQQGGGGLAALDEVPWLWLAGAGVALVVLVLAALAFMGGEEPGKEYVAPRMIDGKIVPGHFE